jgi:hypothetical protein
MHASLVRWMVKEGADTQATVVREEGALAAADLSMIAKTSAEQTAYLEAKTHCSNPGCNGAGTKRCPAFKQARYLGSRASMRTGRHTRRTASGGARSLRRARNRKATVEGGYSSIDVVLVAL